MSNNFDAIIIGAGITGASTAYHLKENGFKRILLLDRGGSSCGRHRKECCDMQTTLFDFVNGQACLSKYFNDGRN